MTIRLVWPLALILALAGCASRPDVYRRTALTVADELRESIDAWNEKARVEQDFANAMRANLVDRDKRDFLVRLELLRTSQINGYIDTQLAEPRAVSLTAMRDFVEEVHDRRRDAFFDRERRVRESEREAAARFEKVLFDRVKLDRVEKAVRATAAEPDEAVRRRLLKEWGDKAKEDYERLKTQK
jgi:hypothetical protein